MSICRMAFAPDLLVLYCVDGRRRGDSRSPLAGPHVWLHIIIPSYHVTYHRPRTAETRLETDEMILVHEVQRLPKKEIQEPKLFVFCFSLHCVPALGGRALSLLIPPGHSLCGPSSSRRLAEALLLSTWDKLLPMGRRQFLGCLSAQGAAGVRNRQKKMLCMSDLPYRKSLGRHGSSAPDPANVQGVMPSN